MSYIGGMTEPPAVAKVYPMTEKAAKEFVSHTVARYGAASALALARRKTHEYRENEQPKWLRRAIEMLDADEACR